MLAPFYVYLIALICLAPVVILWAAGGSFLYRILMDWLTQPEVKAPSRKKSRAALKA